DSAVSRKLPPAATKASRTACEPASSAVHPKVLVPRLIGKMDSSVPGISTCVIVLLLTVDVDGLGPYRATIRDNAASGAIIPSPILSVTGPHLRSRSMRRSDSFLPPVWQCGQYWSDRSAKDTSAIVVPHTGHVLPVRPWTENPRFFAALTFPGGRPLSACRVVVRTALMASSRVSASTVFAVANGESFAVWRISSE